MRFTRPGAEATMLGGVPNLRANSDVTSAEVFRVGQLGVRAGLVVAD